MQNFKYTRTKDKFIFGNEDVKIVYSDPKIQGFSDYSTLTSYKEIMYYYYNVEYYHTVWKNKKNQWVKLASAYAYDGSGLLRLLPEIDSFLNTPIEKCQKDVYQTNSGELVNYQYHWRVYGEDFYDLIYVAENNEPNSPKTENPRFRLFAGTCKNNYDMTGVSINNMSKDDFMEFVECVKAFVNYSIDKHNHDVAKRNTIAANGTSIENNRLYVRDEMNHIQNICMIGDVVSVVISDEDENRCWKEQYKELDYVDWTITSLDDKVTLSCDGRESIVIDPHTIVYLNQEVTDEQLHYDIDAVAKDFRAAMSDSDVDFFRNSDAIKIAVFYMNAIIDRTWMCRSEHAFRKNYKGGMEEVGPFVGQVIEKIKSLIS